MDNKLREGILSNINRQEIVKLECDLVAIPSFVLEEAELAQFIASEMRGFGLEAQLQEVPQPEGGIGYNVIGRLPGSGKGPTLLLFGHMDSGHILGREYEKFENWKRDPFKPLVEGEWIFGKGSQDDKGGLCALITAAKALIRAGFKPKGSIYFVCVQGHRQGSRGILHILDTGFKADYAVNTENSGNAVVTVSVGTAQCDLHVRAPIVHWFANEQVPRLKGRTTAMGYFGQLLEALGPEVTPPAPDSWMNFNETPGLEGYPQIRIERLEFHQGHSHGYGDLDDVELSLQVRTVPGQTDETIRTDLQRLVERLTERDPHFRVDIHWPSWPPSRPPVKTLASDSLVQSFASWHQFVSGVPAHVGSRGRLGAAADASHIAGRLKIPTILYGPGDWIIDFLGPNGELEADERIKINDIVVASKVYALAAAELCG